MGAVGGPKIKADMVGAFDVRSPRGYDSGNILNIKDTSDTTTDGAPANSPVISSDKGTIQFGKNGTARNTYIVHDSSSGVGSFDFNGYSAGYSVSIWVKRTAYGTWLSGNTNYDGIWNYYWNHNLSFSGEHTNVNRIQGTGLSGYNIAMDRWYHVVTTHDNTLSSNNHNVYINGTSQGITTQSHPTLNSGNVRRFFIGNWDSSWAMVGEVGVYYIYDRPISKFEVSDLYNAHKNRYV